MSLSKSLLPEFDQEMTNTRRVLERVPEDKLAWKPHEKSMSLGRLASHVAEMLRWAETTIRDESFDVAPVDGTQYQAADLGSRQEILDLFDRGVAATRALLEQTEDATLMQPWSLKKGGEAMFTLPRIAVLRGMVMNHIIHHRGQLSVYLRLTGAPVPAIYGPSADEPL
jgi:uncharacterized damage-inducible protein DinB